MCDTEKYLTACKYEEISPGVWARDLYMSSPKCKTSGKSPLLIVRFKEGDFVDVELSGLSKFNHWVEFTFKDISKSNYPKLDKAMHYRMFDCWKSCN